MPAGFYPRTTPKSRSPPKRRIADLRFAALLDDDNDEASSTVSSNNSSDDSLFLHLEEESLLDITRSEKVPSSPTPSIVEEDTDSHDNLLGIMPLDKLDQLQMPKLIDPQQDIAVNDCSNISPTTTATNLLFSKADDDTKSTECSSEVASIGKDAARLNNRQSYPMLNDTQNNFNRTDATNYPIQVEMAKSAFLKNPTPELWNELVSCFRYMMFINNNNNNSLHDGLQNDICLEEEVNGSTVEFTSDEISHDLAVDNEDEGWATFDDEQADLMNNISKLSTARLPREETTNTVKNHHHEPTSFEFIGNVEINEVLSTIIPKEEKTMFNQIFPEMTNEKNRNEEDDVWSEERDVSPPTSPDRSCDDDSSSSSEYDPDLISLGQSSQEESVSQLNESFESSEACYVLNEVSSWEKRIDRYDQRYVNIVAAALEEVTNDDTEGEWLDGQILEVLPVDNEDVLYVV